MPARTSHPDASFAYAFNITRGPADDWFDVRLHSDTDLFVDPFLMFDEANAPWSTVHGRVIGFFNAALEHVARAGRQTGSVEWQRAAAMFSFPEPAEFCLGYGKNTIFGSGTGRGLGEGMLVAAQQALNAGIRHVDDFGDLLLFGEYFGADRISDMVCNIVKDVFIEYTMGIAARHSIATPPFRVTHAGYDATRHRWRRRSVQLPMNPCWDIATPILLVPERFLDELPRMNDGPFWDWVYSNENEQLRKDLGYEVTVGLNKDEILDLAKRSMRLRWRYGKRYARALKSSPPVAYDLRRDPKLKIVALDAAQRANQLMTLTPPETEDELCQFVRELIEKYRHSVEDSGLWKSLWENGEHRSEKDAQRIFWAIVMHLCPFYDVDVTPEADEGVGPVDFKFSRGSAKKALAEFKLADNSEFWNNLETQLPAYLRAAAVDCGFFVVIQFKDKHCTPAFKTRVRKIVAAVAKQTKRKYRVEFVDARKKPSASKIKKVPSVKRTTASKTAQSTTVSAESPSA